MKLDYLAFAAHPDDVELAMGGTMAVLAAQGKSIGICDLTRGEMGTRGSTDQRKKESVKASEILGLSVRENLGLPDAGLKNTREFQLPVIQIIRKYRPDIVFINAPDDRHPDHGHAAELLIDALFFSGLRKLETFDDAGKAQEVWRPHHTFHYMQDRPFEPSIIIDVSDYFEHRLDSILAYESQFNAKTSSEEPQTYISSPAFFEQIKARARVLGHQIGCEYGEGFLYHKGPIPAKDFSMFESVKPTR
jgi:bacillithiol biosynthesis deacetylase BshB1